MEEKEKEDELKKPLIALGVLALLALLLSKKFGWGMGFGFGSGKGLYATGIGPVCKLRVDANGISQAGKAISGVNSAVAACRAMNASQAEILSTGDAIYGTVEHLKQALMTAGFMVRSRTP